MKKWKFTEEQIAFTLKQAKTGATVEKICRKIGISQATFYAWRKKFGGLGVAELRRLRQLEEENRKLKQLVAAQTSAQTQGCGTPPGAHGADRSQSGLEHGLCC